MGTIVIHRRVKPEEEQEDSMISRVGIDWEKCVLYATVEGVVQTISDFNTFLLEFLHIGSVDRYEIMGVLGYNPQDLDVAANRQSSRKKRLSPERSAFTKTTARDTDRSPRPGTESDYNEKSKLIAKLRYHYEQKVSLRRLVWRSELHLYPWILF